MQNQTELETAQQHLQGLITDQQNPRLLNEREASIKVKIDAAYATVADLESQLAAVQKRRMTLDEEIGKAKANLTALRDIHVKRVETAKKAPVINRVNAMLDGLSEEELQAVLNRVQQSRGATP